MAKNKGAKSWIKGDRSILLIVGIIVASVVLFTIVLSTLRTLTATEEYYQLTTEIPANTQITPDMVEAVVTQEGTAPQSLGMGAIQTGNVYSRYSMDPGDILMNSNVVSALESVDFAVPEGWVVTSFSVGADNAVQGRIRTGDYFDMMVLNDNGEAFYPFVNVLVLDTSVSLGNASSSEAIDTPEAQAGQTEQYTVAMTPEDAAKLQSTMARYSTVKLVKPQSQDEFTELDIREYAGLFSISGNGQDAVWPGEEQGNEPEEEEAPIEEGGEGTDGAPAVEGEESPDGEG